MKDQLARLSRHRTTRFRNKGCLRGIKEISGAPNGADNEDGNYQFRIALVDRKTNVTKFGNIDSFYRKAPLKVFEHLKKMIMFDHLRKSICELEGLVFFDLH